MITLTTTKAKLLFVEVPDDATNIVVHNNLPMIVFESEICNPEKLGGDIIRLPSGSTYTFLFTTKQGREEDWKGVVEYEINPMDDFIEGYLDYERGEPWYTKDTATESGLSLQKENGMDVNKNWAVIEVKN